MKIIIIYICTILTCHCKYDLFIYTVHSLYIKCIYIYIYINNTLHLLSLHTTPCVTPLNVNSNATETMSKIGASTLISSHLKSSHFSTSGKNRLLNAHMGATCSGPQPEQSKRGILMIPDKIVRQYSPGCDDTLHYSR